MTAWRDGGGPGSWLGALGLQVDHVGADAVLAHLDVSEVHHTPFGVVHGGVLSTLVEWVCSLGASASLNSPDMIVVGTHNSTDFLRPISHGRLDARATPVFVGRVQQLWSVDITDHQDGRLIAQGRLRLQNVARQRFAEN
ncbi:MAG: PaaI family thioesterase [Acidimicrobiales bacterium]